MVRIKLYGKLGSVVGRHELTAEGGTVRDVIQDLAGRYGTEFEKALRAYKVFHNGENVAFGRGAKTTVAQGDEVVFLSPVAGG